MQMEHPARNILYSAGKTGGIKTIFIVIHPPPLYTMCIKGCGENTTLDLCGYPTQFIIGLE